MRKFMLLGLVALAGPLLGGCLMADFAKTTTVTTGEICESTCADQPGTGSGYVDWIMGTEGPSGSLFPDERGEYWSGQKFLEPPETAGCTRFPGAGAGSANIIHNYHNDSSVGLAAAGTGGVVGCPPFTLCGWSGPGSGFGACEPPLVDDAQASLCNGPNSACDDPSLPFFTGTPAPDPGPGYLGPDGMNSWVHFQSIDTQYGATTGGPCGFGDNLRKRPGTECIDCSALGPAPTPGDDHKIEICHVPRGNPDNAHTISIDVAAWPAHEAHGDNQGPCGGGPGGPGLAVDDANLAPDWALAICFFVALPEARLLDGLPWIEQYGGNASAAAQQQLVDIVNNHGVNDQGLATLGITRMTANGNELVFSPALEVDLGLEIVRGQLASKTALNIQQDGIEDFVRFLMANTASGREIDLTAFNIELESGLRITGGTLASAMPYGVSINHDRFARFLENLQGASTMAQPRLEARHSVR